MMEATEEKKKEEVQEGPKVDKYTGEISFPAIEWQEKMHSQGSGIH